MNHINVEESSFVVERVMRYDNDLTAALGGLLLHLSDRADGAPISEAKLRSQIESPSVEQIIAHASTRLLDAATLTQLGGLMPTNKGWLEDFVVAPEARGLGVADAIADEWEDWARQREITTIMFTSGWDREAAHKFYLRRGAVILNDKNDKTAFFNYPIQETV